MVAQLVHCTTQGVAIHIHCGAGPRHTHSFFFNNSVIDHDALLLM